MNALTGSQELDNLIRNGQPKGLEMKLSLEEYILIVSIRNKEATNVEVKTHNGVIKAINETIHFDTHKTNAERILTKYQSKGEVVFTPRGKDKYHVKVTYRSK